MEQWESVAMESLKKNQRIFLTRLINISALYSTWSLFVVCLWLLSPIHSSGILEIFLALILCVLHPLFLHPGWTCLFHICRFNQHSDSGDFPPWWAGFPQWVWMHLCGNNYPFHKSRNILLDKRNGLGYLQNFWQEDSLVTY